MLLRAQRNSSRPSKMQTGVPPLVPWYHQFVRDTSKRLSPFSMLG